MPTTRTTSLTSRCPNLGIGTCCIEQASALETIMVEGHGHFPTRLVKGQLHQNVERTITLPSRRDTTTDDGQNIPGLPTAGQVVLIHVPEFDLCNKNGNKRCGYISFVCRLPFRHNTLSHGTATLWFDTSLRITRERPDGSNPFINSSFIGWLDNVHVDDRSRQTGSRICTARFHLGFPSLNSCDGLKTGLAMDGRTGFIESIGFPTALLSLRLWYHSHVMQAPHHTKAREIETTESPIRTKNHLLHACLKRNLVGCVLLWKEENYWNTLVELDCLGREHQFSIESLTPNGRESKCNCVLFTISPSTIITFLSKPLSLPRQPGLWYYGTKNDKTTAKDDDTTDRLEDDSISSLSPTAELLEETLRMVLIQQDWELGQDATTRPSAGLLQPPRSFLLTGPPGVGKTHAVRSAVSSLNKGYVSSSKRCHLVAFAGSDLMARNGNLLECAQELENEFHSAASFFCNNDLKKKKNSTGGVVLLFLDEAESLVSSTIMGTKLALLLDQLNDVNNRQWSQLVVVAATNRIHSIPAYLRRSGRLDQEIVIGPPSVDVRTGILTFLLRQQSTQFVTDIDTMKELSEFAALCIGYVPADLGALVRRAMMLLSDSSTVTATMCNGQEETTLGSIVPATVSSKTLLECMYRAKEDVGASALRDAALKAPPTTTWDDIAGDPGGAKTALRQSIEWPRIHRETFQAFGLIPPRGILLTGPPGCAKTSLARAAAGASGVAFLSLSPADVYASSFVGEAEGVIRRAFTLARSAAPCILFFDEIDAIVGTESNNTDRSNTSSNSHFRMGRGSSAEARVLSTFLNEMDGIDVQSSSVDGVLVLAATNRPGTLDAALLRPGRFDKIITVPPPDEGGRRAILKLQTRSWPKKKLNNNKGMEEGGLDLDKLARDEWTKNMTGAEIVGACRDAALSAWREAMAVSKQRDRHDDKEGALSVAVCQRHLEEALARVQPLLADDSN